MFEVIHDEQDFPATEMSKSLLALVRYLWFETDVHCDPDSLEDMVWMFHGSQINQEDTISKWHLFGRIPLSFHKVFASSQRQACFPHSSRGNDGDQAYICVGEQLDELV